MPAAMEYVRADKQEGRALEQAFTKEINARREAFDLGVSYYRGTMRQPLKMDATRTQDNVLLPLVENLIDKSVATMLGVDDQGMIEGVKFEFPHDDERSTIRRVVDRRMGNTPPDPPEQQALDALWKANRKNRFLHDVMLTGALAGHIVIRIMPDELMSDHGFRVPRFVNLNPRNFAAFWQEDDVESVLWYRVQIGSERQRRTDFVKATATGETVDGWLIYEYERDNQYRQWQMVGEEPEVWEFPWAPIVEWQNLPVPKSLSFYGKDDIGILGNINDAINFLISNQQRILKYHASPKLALIGDTLDDDTDAAVEGDDTDTEDKAQADLGIQELMEISADGDLKYVEMMNDGKGTLDMIALLSQVFYDAGREVSTATIKDKIGQITNFGLRVMYQDSLTKRHNKWLEAADGLMRLSQYGLELMGFAPMTPVNVIPPPALPLDPEAESRSLQTAVQVFGLSQDSALDRLGFDPDDERSKRDRASRETISNQTRSRQTQQADETRGLGTRIRDALQGSRETPQGG